MPGTVYPRKQPRTTGSHAETAVWKALQKNLPDGWRAWHSLKLRVGRGWEGEGDFVIANPDRGMLILEVKGGHIELNDGLWTQNGQKMDPPRDQAFTFAKNLALTLRRKEAAAPAWGIACAFPDAAFSEPPTNGDLQGLVVGQRELAWLGHMLPSMFDRAMPKKETTEDTGWMDALNELWGETWVPHVRLRDRVEDASKRLVMLDDEQLLMLEFAQENKRALAEGQAGSGKTIIAREICRRRAKDGERVLYLCFTDALAQAVGASFKAELGESAPTATSVRRYAQQLAGGEPDSNPDWIKTLRTATERAAEQPTQFDFVVVDEAQDLEPDDWAFIEQLAKSGGLWVFRDRRQGFWVDRSVPERLSEPMAKLLLLAQKRNPPEVAALAQSYVDGGVEHLKAGDEVVRVVAQAESLETALTAELDRLVALGASPNEIAVLSAAGQTRTELLRLESAGKHPLHRADSDGAQDHVVADTFLRFKGLERPFVIVVEADLAEGERYETRMHIAVTRATTGLVLLCTPKAIAADPRLEQLTKEAPTGRPESTPPQLASR